jgi:hypothetical protein
MERCESEHFFEWRGYLRLQCNLQFLRVGNQGPDKRAISNDVGGVKSFLGLFLLLIIKFAQTSASTHELRPFPRLLFICVTPTCSARLCSSTRSHSPRCDCTESCTQPEKNPNAT